MDNQHKLIKGYRDLSQVEIDLMNEIKAKSVEISELLDNVYKHLKAQCDKVYDVDPYDEQEESRLDLANPFEWYNESKRELQTAFMKLVRSVAQPTTF